MASRNYGGVTPIERRARRRAVLLDAALNLVAASGVSGLTVRGVCTEARLNDRYFYESFRSTDELLLAMLDEQMIAGSNAIFEAIAESSQSNDPVVRTRAAVGTGLKFLTDDPRRGRLLVESQATEGLAVRRRDLVKTLAQVMADQGRVLLPADDALDPDLDLATFTLVSGGLDLVTSWFRGELDITRDRLEDFLVALVTRANIKAEEEETRLM
ncbi:TetR/AcrR family transcriptional regulator [Mycobacterium sp. CBMA271]|uniref:TetR/AcrR family transcriptional regulator n=1 Tax=unclassified Mycobacteroides TaxID=2618759 RepID=UPI0012DE9C6B|nr:MULTISPECIES: TetR/AcrR family transcriptional regulator [unclassified Mycobacteroides]MUM16810.1 TetR family transcriptional regulator [Mycobacteroides sp. CBMA 326]MUM20283.1 TetR/AcrR family transcriptional regulator [Mycobacteroides sp. CBMA 271]